MGHSDPPSPAATPRKNVVRVLSVPTTGTIAVRFLAGLLGCVLHWKGKGSDPCPGGDKCSPAIHRGRSIFKAYAPVQHWDAPAQMWFCAVLEATANLEEQLRGRQLRGEVWFLSREIQGEKNSAVFGLYSETIPETRLPKNFDIRPVLQRMWNTDAFLLGVPNPMPAKVFLPGDHGDQPKLPFDVSEVAPPAPTDDQLRTIRDFVRGKRKADKPAKSNPGLTSSHEEESNGQAHERNGHS
jgi:hypothetical protein